MPPLPVYFDEYLASLSAPELWQLLVSNEDRVPRNLIDECTRRGDAILELTEGLLQKDYYWDDDITPGEWWLPLHAAMILGLMPSQRAGELLVAYMRRLDELDDEALDEWLAGYWPVLFQNKSKSVLPPLRRLAEDRAVGFFERAAASDAALAYGHSHPEYLDETVTWVASLVFDSTENYDFRVLAGHTLIAFARPELRAGLEALADLQPKDFRMFDRREIEEAYAGDALPHEWEWETFQDAWIFYAPDKIAERQRLRAEEEAEEDDDSYVEPYVRTEPKIGRNDPCPCGSGKKYKKCCLPKAS